MISRKRIRFAADSTKKTDDYMEDVLSASQPYAWRGNDIQFEVGIFENDEMEVDVSNIVSMTLEIRKNNSAGVILATKTIASFSTISEEHWGDGTEQHALIAFTGEEMNFAAGTHWLAIAILTNDSPGHAITLGGTNIIFAEDGIGNEADVQAVDGTAYTKDQADARFVQKHEDQAWVRFTEYPVGTGKRWFHYIESTGLWYPEVAEIKDGVPELSLGEGVAL